MNHVVNPVFQTSNFGWFINPYPSKRQLIEDGNSSHLTGGLSALATHCRTSCSAGVTLKASRNKAMASCGWCFGSSFKDNKMLHPLNSAGNPNFYGIPGVGRWLSDWSWPCFEVLWSISEVIAETIAVSETFSHRLFYLDFVGIPNSRITTLLHIPQWID